MVDELNDTIVGKVQQNIKVLMNGGKLTDDGGNKISFIEIVLGDEDMVPADFTFEEFSELEEYIEPKTERELELEARIAELESQVSAGSGEYVAPKAIKPRVVYDKSSQLKIATEWKVDRRSSEPMNLKAMAKKHNISSNYLVTILNEFGVYSPKKKKQKITGKVD